MPKLTKRTVDSVRPGDRDIMLWDDDLPGFGLRVKPTGVRSFLVQYRNAQGRSRRYTIGRHGVFTPDHARKEAARILAAARRGEDPAAKRAAARKPATLSEMCDRYSKEHTAVHNRPRTSKEANRLVEKHIRPALGTLQAAAVTRQDVAKLHRSMDATPRLANHVLAILSKIFTLAECWGVRPEGSNPCRLVKRYPEAKRERSLSEEELERLGSVLSQAENKRRELPDVINTIRLLVFTGCRLGEIVNLRWEDVDFDAGALVLPESKAGGRVRVVGGEAMRILSAIPRRYNSPWVLHGRNPERPLRDDTVKQAWRRIRKQAGIEDVHLHDLRHTVATHAEPADATSFMVRDMPGRKPTG